MSAVLSPARACATLPPMTPPSIDALLILAGWGEFPLLVADAARRQGVKRIEAIGFRGQTSRRLPSVVDRFTWVRMGQFGRFMEAVRGHGVRHAMMVGQIHPTGLFHARFDALALRELKQLSERNAHTIYGRIAELLGEEGVECLPCSSFMSEHMPPAGVLTDTAPDEATRADLDLGFRVADQISALDIGQTVVIKDGSVLAVEAFEGTNRAIRRGARLGGRGSVVIKVAKHEHDNRFDIPVVGHGTLKAMRRVGVKALGVQAGRVLFLDRERVLREANALGIVIEARDGAPSLA